MTLYMSVNKKLGHFLYQMHSRYKEQQCNALALALICIQKGIHSIHLLVLSVPKNENHSDLCNVCMCMSEKFVTIHNSA